MSDTDFETAWRVYINGPDDTDEQARLLHRCIEAATSINELIRVFNAASEGYTLNGVRSPALKKMITLVKTRAEAQQVYTLASMRSSQGYVFKKVQPEAKKKLDSFSVT